MEDNDFTIIAYEETIKSSKEQKVREILNRKDWGKSKLDLDKVGSPNYKFFFNKHINKIGSKIVVYSVWISPESGKLELTKNHESEYVQLDRGDSKVILELITTDLKR